MKTRRILIICFLIFEAFLVQASPNAELKESETKRIDDWSIEDSNISLDEETAPEAQRKRDPGYYYNKPNRFPSINYLSHLKHAHRVRVPTKLQKLVNRPFSQYGPPNHGISSLNHVRPTSINANVNQEVPVPIRQTEFIEESPIASQNNLPFGQHTANYLPPKNQKLPSHTTPHLFSNQNHDFPRPHHLQHQQQQQQQQQQLQIQQQQHFHQVEQEQREQHQQLLQQQFNQAQHYNQLQQQQEAQVQTDQQNSFGNNQNSFGHDFINTPNFNQQQHEINNQQISDAALFLTQNAPAISQLYETPALNQNYAPYDQEFQQGGQNQILNQNQHTQFPNQQLPSYSSGILNAQQTLEHVKSLEKDRLINQLQIELSNRENAARLVQENDDISLFPPRNGPSKLEHAGGSFSQPESFSSASSASGSSGYPSYYPPPVTAPPTQPPVLSTPTPPVSTIFPPSHSSSGSGSTHVGSSLPAPGNLKPPTTSVYPQYGGFVPTFVSSTNFVPSIPSFGTTLFPNPVVKPSENAPTHFGIPIPTLQEERPVHPLPNPPTTSKPTSISLHPGISTVSIPLGPVHHFPTQPSIVKPSPIPVIPAATPVHPTYGIHQAVINPSFVYKPVKVYPVYYYPQLGFSSPVRKSVYAAAPSQPWNYAPSYGQAKPIWK